MPYKLSDNGLCVHKLNADGSMGDVMKCHKTPEEAAAHMRALYANVEDAATKAYTGRLGDLLVAKIHQAFTVAADQLAQRGYLLQDQRIALSGVIGDLLGQFNKMIDPTVANYPVDGEDMGEIAEKATAEDNNLPDSAFLYVESGGEKDGEGKTVPRSLRHLPYKTASGAVDLPRLRNALSRLGQANTGDTGGDKWLTASLRDELIAKARRILENSQKAARGKDIDEMILPDDMDVSTLLQGVEDSLDAELSSAELQAVEQLYQDIVAGRVKLETLAEPDAVTGKAQTFPRSGGSSGPAGNPSGTPGGSQGSHTAKQERCFLHLKKMGGDESTARRICRSMFGGKSDKEASFKEQSLEQLEGDIRNAFDSQFGTMAASVPAKMPGPWVAQTYIDHVIVNDGMDFWSVSIIGFGTNNEGRFVADFAPRSEWIKVKRLEAWIETKESPFAVYKQADGQYRWLAVTSSSFQDRDKEIISQKALEADTERMNASGDFGALDWWHTPIVLGACDFSAMHGRLSVESGTFRDAWIATKLAEAKGGFEMSRAFYHPITEPDPQGVYHNIKTFSRAIIPRGKGIASNLMTTFTVVKEENEMGMIADKVKELKSLFGGNQEAEAKVDALLAEAEAKEKAATDAGIAAKEHAERPEAAPEPEKTKEETPISKQPGMFVADMTPEEFDAHIANAVKPLFEQLNAIKEANAVAVKESSANVLAAALVEIKKLQDAQAETAKQVKELNGLTPRGYRATQDPATATTKDAKPGADEKKSHFEQFVNGFVLGQPQPPVR